MKNVFLFTFCLMLTVLPLEITAQSDDETQFPSSQHSNPRVLVLHSYHEGFTWTDNVTKGIRSVFTEEAPDVELLFEFMDVKRLYTDEYLRQLREFYRFKYAGRKIDAIISSDDHALEFLLGVGQDFFPTVPVVFCAVNGYDPARHRSNGRQLTGVVESIDIKATLEIALKLHPKTKEVAVITDQTITGRALKASAEKIFRNYEDRVRFTYLEHLTMEQLWQEVSVLPRESIVFTFIFTRDQFGRIWSHEYNLERLATRCKVPIYSVWEFYLGHGITGGMLTSGQMHGEMAARMALRVLRGENASEIPVVLESPNRYMFDDNQLRRFGVKASSLPKNSIIVNRPFSVYEEYKSLIWGVIAAIVLLLVLVAILVEDIMLRRRTEKALRESEHRHKMVSELISDYIFKLIVNNDGKIVMDLVTENFYTITGRTLEDVQTPDMWAKVIHPDDLEKVMKLLETTVSSGQSGELECRSFIKGGQERWIHIFARPQWDEVKQRTTAIFGAVRDITKRKRAEEELRLFKTIVESSQESVAISDSNGQLLYINPAYEKLFGRSLEEAKKINYRDYYPPESIEVLNRNVAPALARGESWEGVLDVFDVHGRRFPLWERAGSILDAKGNMLYGFGFMHNEIERKRMEETLRLERDKAQQYLDIAGVMFVALNREQNVTLINKKGYEILGYPEDEILGKNWFDHFLPGTNISEVKAVFNRIIAGDIESVEYYENPVLTRDGSQKLIAWHNAVVRDETGNILGTLSSGEDITERKRAEQKLQENERFLQGVFNAIQDGISVLDLDLNIIRVNQWMEKMYAAQMPLAGKKCYEVYQQRQSPCPWCPSIQTIETGETHTENVPYPSTEKPTGWIELSAFPLKSDDGNVVSVIEYVKDITKRKRAEDEIRKLNAELEQRVQQRTAELEAANQELKDFAYVVSHDLKAPLRGISQLSQWLVHDYADAFDEEGEKMVDLLMNRVKRMDGLIEGILEYSRIGRIVGKDVEINLDRLVREVIDNIAPPGDVQILIESKLPVIIGDKIRIAEVFQNLIENAFKFMDKPEGEISIDCADEGSCWKFSVVDNGPGIDPKYHEKIFQIFQTLESRDVRESTGVGLALVKKIIEFYGGKIWIESTPGKGSTFFFRLPKKE